jgi:lipopolysaccharide biosynthesis glycosyltransferase
MNLSTSPSYRPSSRASFVDVASSCDDNYAQHLAAVIASILANASRPAAFRFWILSAGLTPGNRSIFEKVAAKHGAALQILSIDPSKLKNAPVSGHISLASYYRIFLPELLPVSIEKIVYVDADLIVFADLQKLLDLPMGTDLVGAVQNPRFHRWSSLHLSPSMGYFNAGVLLINLAQWRKEDLQQKLCSLIDTDRESLKLHDQDALNRVVAGRWLRLDPRWNQQYSFFLVGPKMLGLSSGDYRRLLRRPFIAHYSGGSKPWVFSDDHPLKSAYYRYLDMTPHAGWRPAGGTPRAWLRRAVLTALPHRLRPALLGL